MFVLLFSVAARYSTAVFQAVVTSKKSCFFSVLNTLCLVALSPWHTRSDNIYNSGRVGPIYQTIGIDSKSMFTPDIWHLACVIGNLAFSVCSQSEQNKTSMVFIKHLLILRQGCLNNCMHFYSVFLHNNNNKKNSHKNLYLY